jgi:hypothetical protein
LSAGWLPLVLDGRLRRLLLRQLVELVKAGLQELFIRQAGLVDDPRVIRVHPVDQLFDEVEKLSALEPRAVLIDRPIPLPVDRITVLVWRVASDSRRRVRGRE